ncbi:hypothetical protein [Brevundimonas halotolerans]|uniref:Uncharacterized protein n=1 Tax=Brevundimonas halotolerans TaxID=69670 RepID=A0A7W9A251_9CAUL|nr:hypothetical protein [Brevundimonas halotolerans]MBB5659999.1 hypothetical protein [Brevundimonas halotolerans]
MSGETVKAVDGQTAVMRTVMWGGAVALLLAPAVAMQFTSEVQWSLFDFALMAVLLAIACGVGELVLRASDSLTYRLGAAVAIGTTFVLGVGNLAVGLIGSEDNPANDRVWAVLAVGVVGALIARFKPRGLSLVMVALAAGQVGLALYADATAQDLPLRITVVFVTGWLVAAALFDRAAREGRA